MKKILYIFCAVFLIAAASVRADGYDWRKLAMSENVGSPSCTIVSYYAPDFIHSEVVNEIKSGIAPRKVLGDRLDRNSVGGISSGVFISGDGCVLTNHHCVTLRGEMARVVVVWSAEYEGSISVLDADLLVFDSERDLALLKVSGGDGKFPSAVLAEKNMEVMEEGLAITAPQGLYFSPVVFRVISVRSGSFLNESLGTCVFRDVSKYIQADRGGIDVGSSGGPAFNKNGELVGIAVSIYREIGVTFASFLISVEDIKEWLAVVAPHIK